MADPQLPPVDREEARGTRARGFEEIYRDLVVLFSSAQSLSEANRAGQTEVEKRASLASELFKEVVSSVPDFGTLTLAKLHSLPLPWPDRAGMPQIHVCNMLLDFALQALSNTDEIVRRRDLVQSMLSMMPLDPGMTAIAAERLVGRPYLEAVHEESLVQLLRGATGSLDFMRAPLVAMLRTLWGNIEKGAGGDYGELLALFEENPSADLGMAATERLLLSERYRAIVIARLCALGSVRLISDACLVAAKKLPFVEAVEAIGQMRSAVGEAHLGAYATLAERFPSQLASHYDECLAVGNRPKHREQVVAALGNYTDPSVGMPKVLQAFDSDPDPRVRGVALLAIGSQAKPREFEPRFDAAILDLGVPRIYVVHGLRNAAPRADINWLDRATAALLASGGLSPDLRASLDQLRGEYLPKR